MEPSVITVAIADDCELFRFLLQKWITRRGDFGVVVEAANGKDLIDKIARLKRLPHICILDIGMPVMNGYDAIKIIMKRWPQIKVLAFSQYRHTYAITTMMQYGARGFISKEESYTNLCDALITIKETGYYYSKYFTKEMLLQVQKGQITAPALTRFERKFLALFCSDKQYDKIAAQQYVSIHTVEKHKQNISNKTGIHSREGLILFAIQSELVNLNQSNIAA